MLKITGLKKSFKKLQVLKGINMDISKGEVYGFLGKNGCGKTTTMNIICDIIPKDEGRIVFDTENATAPSPPVAEEGAPYDAPEKPRCKIGYLTETPALFGYMNGYEYLKYIAACASYDGDVNRRVDETLDIVGMREGARRRIKGYSRGMNQRLGIAAAIFDNPQLLILDEPTSALDPEGRAEVMRIIETLKGAGTTIILCTHIISDVERVADRVGIMGGGIILAEGYVDEVLKNFNTGNSQITLILREPSEEHAALFRALPAVMGSFYDKRAGRVILNAGNVEELGKDVLKLAAENNIGVSEYAAQKINLEDVYMKVTSPDYIRTVTEQRRGETGGVL